MSELIAPQTRGRSEGPEPGGSDLGRLFSPRGVAVVGASESPGTIGGMPLRYLTEFGYAGNVYPVNPKRETLRGLKCYPSILDVPGPCDVALIAVSATHVPSIIRQCGQQGIPFAIVMSAGFGEIGAKGQELEADLLEAIRETGVRVVGPNCLGLLNVRDKVHNGFGAGLDERNYRLGPIAMVTQSGGFGFGLVKAAHREGAGFQYVASVGNSLDLNLLDFIDYYLDDDRVGLVAAFIEGVEDGRRLFALGQKALRVGKPIVVWKAGRTSTGQKAAASHTASLAASYDLYRAAFRQGGFIEVDDYEQLVDISRAVATGLWPSGRRACIVTGSGGAGVVLSDRCEEAGLTLVDISQPIKDRLGEVLPDFASIGNPVDISGQRTVDGGSSSNVAARIVLEDPGVDMVIVRSRQSTADPAHAEELADIQKASGKMVFVTFSADADLESKAVFDDKGVAWAPTASRLAFAANAVAGFAQKKRALDARAAAAPASVPARTLDLPGRGGFLSEADSRACLEAYGIRCVRQHVVKVADIEALRALDLQYPVVVKVNSPDLPHKSEVGGIRLGLTSIEEVRTAARAVVDQALEHRPDARIGEVLVQERAEGTETILGAVNDPCFGPVVVFGLGGVFAEILKDVSYGFAPLDRDGARRMIAEIRGYPLLQGYRGQEPADLDTLAETIVKLSRLISDHADRIESLDINPLFVRGGEVVAADALVVLKEERS